MASSPVMPMSRKERERARQRREILAVAERLFARKGYRATTVEEIAREAEFAVGTVYVLFKDKDDLYIHVIEASAQEFMKQFEHEVVPMHRADEAIAALIELRLAHCYGHRELIRSSPQAAPALRVDPMAAAPNPLGPLYARYTQAVSDIFRRGVSQGVFAVADPHFLALCLEGSIHAFVAHWSRQEPSRPLGSLIEHLKRQFLKQVCARSEGDQGESHEHD